MSKCAAAGHGVTPQGKVKRVVEVRQNRNGQHRDQHEPDQRIGRFPVVPTSPHAIHGMDSLRVADPWRSSCAAGLFAQCTFLRRSALRSSSIRRCNRRLSGGACFVVGPGWVSLHGPLLGHISSCSIRPSRMPVGRDSRTATSTTKAVTSVDSAPKSGTKYVRRVRAEARRAWLRGCCRGCRRPRR